MSFITSEDDNTSFRTSKIPPDFQFLPWSTTGLEETDAPTTDVFSETSKPAGGFWTESSKPSTDGFTESTKPSGEFWTESTKPTTSIFEEES